METLKIKLTAMRFNVYNDNIFNIINNNTRFTLWYRLDSHIKATYWGIKYEHILNKNNGNDPNSANDMD